MYAIGVNSAGQLGLGDIEPREMWRSSPYAVSQSIASSPTTHLLLDARP